MVVIGWSTVKILGFDWSTLNDEKKNFKKIGFENLQIRSLTVSWEPLLPETVWTPTNWTQQLIRNVQLQRLSRRKKRRKKNHDYFCLISESIFSFHTGTYIRNVIFKRLKSVETILPLFHNFEIICGSLFSFDELSQQ